MPSSSLSTSWCVGAALTPKGVHAPSEAYERLDREKRAEVDRIVADHGWESFVIIPFTQLTSWCIMVS